MNWNLSRLQHIMRESAKKTDGSSYTRKLLDKGVDGCWKKFMEEATELAMAAKLEDGSRVIKESGDVIYHLLVVLESRGLSVSLVEEELQRREGKSGLEEKASRQS